MQNTSTLLGLPMLYVKTTENSCSKQHALKMNIRSIFNIVSLFFLKFLLTSIKRRNIYKHKQTFCLF